MVREDSARFPISIHALCEEGDETSRRDIIPKVKFLSTPSARRATSSQILIRVFPMVFLSTPSARRATWRVYAGGD